MPSKPALLDARCPLDAMGYAQAPSETRRADANYAMYTAKEREVFALRAALAEIVRETGSVRCPAATDPGTCARIARTAYVALYGVQS